MAKPNRELTTKLLEEYQETRNLEIRNELVELYLPFLDKISEKIHSRLPQSIDVNDLKGAGVFGLMDAIEGFDFSKGVQFETYCSIRVRGSILDELRAQDWVPRVVRSKSQKLGRAFQELSDEVGREPTEMELAEYLEISLDELAAMTREASITMILPLEHNNRKDDDDYYEDQYEDRDQPEPSDNIIKEELTEFITKSLSHKEKLILILYHFEELTMKEIGEVLLISESRVSQIHSTLLVRLKAQFDNAKAELLF